MNDWRWYERAFIALAMLTLTVVAFYAVYVFVR
jgi:hypothetical protein